MRYIQSQIPWPLNLGIARKSIASGELHNEYILLSLRI